VAARLSPRDLAVLTSLQEFRLMTGLQLRRLHFHGTQLATQDRKSRAALQRLTEHQVVARLQRRVGGIRAGSEGYCYGLSGLGHAVLDLEHDGTRRHRGISDTKPAFTDHVLAVSELAVRLGELALAGICTIEELRAEPGCWRWFGGLGGGQRVLKPDAFVRLGVDEYEVTAFIEQDLATESLPTIGRKLSVYLDYWRSGIEQEKHGIFPRVWWLVPHSARLTAIAQAIQRLPQDVHHLFTVALTDHVPELLTHIPSSEGGSR
jgi:hypothetical protein